MYNNLIYVLPTKFLMGCWQGRWLAEEDFPKGFGSWYPIANENPIRLDWIGFMAQNCNTHLYNTIINELYSNQLYKFSIRHSSSENITYWSTPTTVTAGAACSLNLCPVSTNICQVIKSAIPQPQVVYIYIYIYIIFKTFDILNIIIY